MTAFALVYGPDRYETAVSIAEQNFPAWRNCDHVIIASGEDRAAADPLSASGLSWAYGAPLLLVQSDRTPRCVIEALQEIRARNGPFHLHIVGGPVSVGRGALDDIEANVTNVIWDRLEPYDDRYTLAATIARRMDEERPDDWLLAAPTTGVDRPALIANGENPDKFFDALALGAFSTASGYPILLVGEDYIPAATAQALDDLGATQRYLAGGPATVSYGVESQLDAGAATCERVWGYDRFATAAAVNRLAEEQGDTNAMHVSVAAKLPDALSGGSYMGLRQGQILLTQTGRLPEPTRRHLSDRSDEIRRVYILGGPMSIDPDTRGEISDAIGP
jgi:putative cell wall-binding protein